MNKFAGLTNRAAPQPEKPEKQEVPLVEETRMLGGRVPDSIFREFTGMKMAAEPELRVRKVTTEESLEALVRALRRPEMRAAWLEELAEVRKGRQR